MPPRRRPCALIYSPGPRSAPADAHALAGRASPPAVDVSPLAVDARRRQRRLAEGRGSHSELCSLIEFTLFFSFEKEIRDRYYSSLIREVLY